MEAEKDKQSASHRSSMRRNTSRTYARNQSQVIPVLAASTCASANRDHNKSAMMTMMMKMKMKMKIAKMLL